LLHQLCVALVMFILTVGLCSNIWKVCRELYLSMHCSTYHYSDCWGSRTTSCT